MAGPSPDKPARWRWAAASQIGTSHSRLGTRKQDAACCFLAGPSSSVLCAIVCDGAGSAAFGGQGASLICRALSIGLKTHFRAHDELPTDDDVWGWIDVVRDKLALAAEHKATRRQAFASTLVLLAVVEKGVLIAHVGDGAVVARDNDGTWRALSWPENGEYASTTYFVTDDPAPRVRILRLAADFDAYGVFSDGIEDLALDQKAIIPHEPFFRSMMAPLDAAAHAGKSASLSEALSNFLNSERVCARTDDDKSLILASGRR
jgi:hypothetical protein